MSARTSVSLCMIVKDEEAFLAEAIESAAPAIDEAVIVDTGSTDATVAIAGGYTDRVLRAAGGDFAAARNVSVEAAGSEWVLVLDADERLMPESAARLKEVLSELDDDVLALAVLRYHFFAAGGFASDYVPRLFRNDARLRFRGRIGESIIPAVAEVGGRIDRAPLTINHFGNWRPRRLREAKAARYVELLRQRVAEAPEDAGLRSAYAMTLKKIGRLDAALTQSAAACRLAPHAASVRYRRGQLLRAAGEEAAALTEFRAAAEALDGEALALTKETSPLNMVGVMHLALGRHADAESALRAARERDPRLTHVLVNLGLVEQARGRFAAAGEWFEQAAAENAGFLADHWPGRMEADLNEAFDNETIARFAGLGYHIAFCMRHRR